MNLKIRQPVLKWAPKYLITGFTNMLVAILKLDCVVTMPDLDARATIKARKGLVIQKKY